jgi:hypothetical protein
VQRFRTALHFACAYGHTSVVATLVRLGVDAQIADKVCDGHLCDVRGVAALLPRATLPAGALSSPCAPVIVTRHPPSPFAPSVWSVGRRGVWRHSWPRLGDTVRCLPYLVLYPLYQLVRPPPPFAARATFCLLHAPPRLAVLLALPQCLCVYVCADCADSTTTPQHPALLLRCVLF